MNPFNYTRRQTLEVNIGDTPLGGTHPIRLQSMTNTSTMDTDACTAQALRMVEAGCEYVRLTAQGVKEAENLRCINAALRSQGCMVPLVADIHFNPNAADVAALYVEKVRINPGNYAKDSESIRARFIPFLRICQENHTAIRIGVNHGSLSERIMAQYGDTPAGMVASCMEFLRICVEQQFTDVVVSMKASNTVVMVQSVRQLVAAMEQEGMHFPLHLGVTEAGEGEDGRIKSALGIGALLADGWGDTIRVSLSEAPEAEIPVARKLRDYIVQRAGHPHLSAVAAPAFDYLAPTRRHTQPVHNIGGDHLPIVMAYHTDHGSMTPEYIYAGRALPDKRLPGASYLLDADVWSGEPDTYPAFTNRQLPFVGGVNADLKFLFLHYPALTDEAIACLRHHPELVVIAQSNHPNRTGELRALVHTLMCQQLTNPVIVFQLYNETDAETLQVKAAADMGALLIDGFCDGIFLLNHAGIEQPGVTGSDTDLAFAILQAGRLRTTKTEYISCPGCGRTLFDLQTAVARVKAATAHFTGLKIAVMGCIVNGPGEMADADYGYVGAGRGRISLYKNKECIEKNIPEDEAVDKLLKLINSTMPQ
ncbi:MAG: 4-hydroxy-3-methylbut-2-en-1-yl diphosphate synthase [Prevotellaceae bacterium]|jgi:(E)-4-hydroxy-3-methylbut-2-enyl-diphosphate synthase|nr:4-hydroxy-3-methylbut-2-en-1-yl diphosphate synthase [Prevotellaceae bacterium]